MRADLADDLDTPDPWPVVPPPLPRETLPSWLQRIASVYGLVIAELLGRRHCLTGGWPLAGAAPQADDLAWLSDKTGYPFETIRAMTPASLVPALLDGLAFPQANLAHCLGRFGLLTRPERRGVRKEAAPWIDTRWIGQWGCLGCLEEDPLPYRRFIWDLPWMLTCPRHGTFLRRTLVWPGRGWMPTAPAIARSRPDALLLRLDALTLEAVTHGSVALTHTTIKGGAWVRLLRATLEEVCCFAQDTSALGDRLADLWTEAGLRQPWGAVRELPYEVLSHAHKVQVMLVAALAIDHAQSLVTEWMEGPMAPMLTSAPGSGSRPTAPVHGRDPAGF